MGVLPAALAGIPQDVPGSDPKATTGALWEPPPTVRAEPAAAPVL